MVFLKKHTHTKLNKPSALLCVHGSTGVHRGLGEGAPDQVLALSSGRSSSTRTCSGRERAKRVRRLEPQPDPPPGRALSARVRQRAPGPETSEPLGGVSRHVTFAAHLACPGCSAAEARPRPGIGAGRGGAGQSGQRESRLGMLAGQAAAARPDSTPRAWGLERDQLVRERAGHGMLFCCTFSWRSEGCLVTL